MYISIKYPFAHLSKDGNSVLFFEADFEDDKPIASWDDIPANYPRWSIATSTRKEALGRVREMVKDENWELHETSEEELKGLVG